MRRLSLPWIGPNFDRNSDGCTFHYLRRGAHEDLCSSSMIYVLHICWTRGTLQILVKESRENFCLGNLNLSKRDGVGCPILYHWEAHEGVGSVASGGFKLRARGRWYIVADAPSSLKYILVGQRLYWLRVGIGCLTRSCQKVLVVQFWFWKLLVERQELPILYSKVILVGRKRGTLGL